MDSFLLSYKWNIAMKNYLEIVKEMLFELRSDFCMKLSSS